MIDCIFVSECLDRLIVNEFGFVLQLGKIVASIEQKLVSLNDIVTCRAPFKTESNYWMSSSLIVTVNLLKMIVIIRLFGLLLMIFCYLCRCFCIVKYILSKSWMFLCFSFWMGNAYYWKVTFLLLAFPWSKLLLRLIVINHLFRNFVWKSCRLKLEDS